MRLHERSKMSQIITLADISKEANVSLNTAAKVLAGDAKKARISDKTAKKILKIADKLGYTPNIMARNLRAKKTGIIGVCVADMTDTTYVDSSHLILQKLYLKGLTPLLTSGEVGLDMCFQQWLQNRIEGLILCGTTKQMNSDFFEKLIKHNITAVIAGCAYRDPDQSQTQPNISVVSIDNRLGMQLAINHLLERGHKKIVHIAGPDWHADAHERQSAYEDIIRKFHEPIVVGKNLDDLFWKRGYNAVPKLLELCNNFDAIITYADQVAVGTIKYLTEKNMAIPDDIAVVSFDNSPESEYCTPSLTTIALPAEQIAEQTLILLKDNLDSEKNIKKIQIPPTLVTRKST